LFRAFVKGDKPIPNAAVEKADEWNKRTVTKGKNSFLVADGKLKQTANDCVNSTKTLFPVDGTNWRDYTVVLDVWDRDNDSFSILFRYTKPDAYYNFTIGAGDFTNRWFLGDSATRENDCFDGAASKLGTGPNGLNIDETGKTAYTAMVRVKGSKIEVFFGEQVSKKDILAGKTPPKVGEANDSNHKKGTAGLHFGSNPADLANIYVFGPGGPRAVDVKDKLSTLWGRLKSAY
jgi:hypothetical protein